MDKENLKSDKITRILEMYTKLMNGCVLNKMEEAEKYEVKKSGRYDRDYSIN